MRGWRWLTAGLLALVLAACTTVTAPLPPPQLLPTPETAAPLERELMVMVPLDDGQTLQSIQEELAEEHPVRLVAMWPMASIDLFCMVFEALPGHDRQAVIDAVAQDPRVVISQTMNEYRTTATPISYDDPLLPLQRGVDELGVLAVHSELTGAGVEVAVVDTAVDLQHPDLQRTVRLTQDFMGAPPAAVGESHGTAIAGVIAAEGNNGIGVVGIAPGASLVGLRGCGEIGPGRTGRCSSFTLARAINVAILEEVDVINLSLTGPFDPTIARLLDAAIVEDISIVAALNPDAGATFPASYDGVIAVAAEPGSSKTTLRAPSEDVLTTAPGGKYDYFAGSSLAAAHVSGLIALIREQAPEMTSVDIAGLFEWAKTTDELTICMLLQAVQADVATAGCPTA